jgi:hypothetical protein
MRWRSGLLTACSALLVAGCSGHRAAPAPRPKIPAGVAARLAAEADRVAALAPRSCGARDAAARFRRDVIATIGRIPTRYQEPLASAANALAERTTPCVRPTPKPTGKRRHEPHRHGKKKHDDEHGEER